MYQAVYFLFSPHSINHQYALNVDSSFIYFPVIIVSSFKYWIHFDSLWMSLTTFLWNIHQPLNQIEGIVSGLCPWSWNLFELVLYLKRLLSFLLHAEYIFLFHNICFLQICLNNHFCPVFIIEYNVSLFVVFSWMFHTHQWLLKI